MTIEQNMEKLANRIKSVAKKINKKNAQNFLKELIIADRIFVTGAGRSGFAAKAFAMRLMHLGLRVYVVGETTTPAIEKNDLLVVISGSGKTTTIVDIVKAAKKKGAKIACLTHGKNSPIRKLSKIVIELQGLAIQKKYKDYTIRQVMGKEEPIAPLGTLFELSAMSFLDSVTIELMKLQKKSENSMKKLHSNLE